MWGNKVNNFAIICVLKYHCMPESHTMLCVNCINKTGGKIKIITLY